MIRQQSPFVQNLIWFITSLVLSIVIWFIASLEVNPISEQTFENIPVDVIASDTMIITSVSTENVDVTVRSPETVRRDDIVVQADLTGRSSGSYTIPLNVQVARTATGDTQPRQIVVVLEQAEIRLKPIEVDVQNTAVSFSVENVQHELQAEVRGSLDAVTAVAALQATLDLQDQRTEGSIDRTLTLVAIDEGGNEVPNVTIEPRAVSVSADIRRRDDVREVAVNPRVLFEELPENFEFRSIDYDPRTVVISGSPDLLAQVGDTVDTQPISLENRTEGFTTEVALDLPSDELIVVSETGIVTVEIEIEEQTTSIALENIPVTLIGAPENMVVRGNPETISLVLSGPATLLEGITAQDVQVIASITVVEPGTYEITPTVSLRQGQISPSAVSITLLPERVTVTINSPTPEATEAATAEATAPAN